MQEKEKEVDYLTLDYRKRGFIQNHGQFFNQGLNLLTNDFIKVNISRGRGCAPHVLATIALCQFIIDINDLASPAHEREKSELNNCAGFPLSWMEIPGRSWKNEFIWKVMKFDSQISVGYLTLCPLRLSS